MSLLKKVERIRSSSQTSASVRDTQVERIRQLMREREQRGRNHDSGFAANAGRDTPESRSSSVQQGLEGSTRDLLQPHTQTGPSNAERTISSSGGSSSFAFDSPVRGHSLGGAAFTMPDSSPHFDFKGITGLMAGSSAEKLSGRRARSSSSPSVAVISSATRVRATSLISNSNPFPGLPNMSMEVDASSSDALLKSMNAQLDMVAARLGLPASGTTPLPPTRSDRISSPAILLRQSQEELLVENFSKCRPSLEAALEPPALSSDIQGARGSEKGSGDRSLEDLERLLNKAVGDSGLAYNTDPRTAKPDDGGPFDISELWATSPETDPSASEATTATSSAHFQDMPTPQSATYTSSNTRGRDQHQKQQYSARPKHGSETRKGFPSGNSIMQATSSKTLGDTYSARVSGSRQTAPQPVAGATSAGSLRKRASSAPRMRISSPSGIASPAILPDTSFYHGQRNGGSQLTGSVQQLPPDFSFKPTINANSRRMVQLTYPDFRGARIEQLAVPRALSQAAKHNKVRQQLVEEEMKECTFTPRTGRPPSNKQQWTALPVHDRLYESQPTWQERREEELQSRQEALLAECTFQPLTNHSLGRPFPSASMSSSMATQQQRPVSAGPAKGRPQAAKSDIAPLYERVREVLRSKSEKVANTRISMELEVDGAFKPRINQKSIQMVARKEGADQEDAGLRLYQQAMKRRLEASRSDVDREDQECTFAPAVTNRSRVIMEKSTGLPGSFLERQAHLAALATEKRAMFKSLLDSAECTFKPDLHGGASQSIGGDGSKWISSGSSSRGGTGGGRYSPEFCGSPVTPRDGVRESVTKLAYQDVRRSQALREALDQHYYGQLSFSPEINPKSRAIGRRHSLEDLYRGTASGPSGNRHSRNIVAAAVIDREAEECLFRPALNRRSLVMAEQVEARRVAAGGGGGSLLDGVAASLQQQKDRERKLLEARALKEAEELQECTFAPEIKRRPPSPVGKESERRVPLLAGVTRHLELLALARKRREEQRKVEDKVWNRKPQGSRNLFTVPQPFSFQQEVGGKGK
ncbi:hypothetical protein CEUSTIGMA_g5226.t1 [Chlamydomonas eustigma]|uniref:Uncharacterized protein n=1 Tax=Chlamydomonas eustigma TaxID=1157962 RepID=A0A250X3X9_9CHLO|nr:hypothetical protein CEUSTIGMA_g5226.t1 [Chlamydomonas eustigma]|eukprot:GAX77783.1 hypothetical protein CEUSTIGMA_g5226.t1 [Chlamydomonas eustigma]